MNSLRKKNVKRIGIISKSILLIILMLFSVACGDIEENDMANLKVDKPSDSNEDFIDKYNDLVERTSNDPRNYDMIKAQGVKTSWYGDSGRYSMDVTKLIHTNLTLDMVDYNYKHITGLGAYYFGIHKDIVTNNIVAFIQKNNNAIIETDLTVTYPTHNWEMLGSNVRTFTYTSGGDNFAIIFAVATDGTIYSATYLLGGSISLISEQIDEVGVILSQNTPSIRGDFQIEFIEPLQTFLIAQKNSDDEEKIIGIYINSSGVLSPAYVTQSHYKMLQPSMKISNTTLTYLTTDNIYQEVVVKVQSTITLDASNEIEYNMSSNSLYTFRTPFGDLPNISKLNYKYVMESDKILIMFHGLTYGFDGSKWELLHSQIEDYDLDTFEIRKVQGYIYVSLNNNIEFYSYYTSTTQIPLVRKFHDTTPGHIMRFTGNTIKFDTDSTSKLMGNTYINVVGNLEVRKLSINSDKITIISHDESRTPDMLTVGYYIDGWYERFQ